MQILEDKGEIVLRMPRKRREALRPVIVRAALTVPRAVNRSIAPGFECFIDAAGAFRPQSLGQKSIRLAVPDSNLGRCAAEPSQLELKAILTLSAVRLDRAYRDDKDREIVRDLAPPSAGNACAKSW